VVLTHFELQAFEHQGQVVVCQAYRDLWELNPAGQPLDSPFTERPRLCHRSRQCGLRSHD